MPASSMEYQGGVSSTNTDLAAIGTTSGGTSTLGISSSDLVGTFNVTSSLPVGYGSGFTFNSLSSAVQSGIDADINNNQPLRLIVVAENVDGSTGEVDWDGNYTGDYPQVSLNVTPAPLVNFSSTNFTVNEADQNPGNTTTDTITVDRTSNPSTTTTINYTMTDGTATVAGRLHESVRLADVCPRRHVDDVPGRVQRPQHDAGHGNGQSVAQPARHQQPAGRLHQRRHDRDGDDQLYPVEHRHSRCE